jgi:hypothetical protein
MKLTGTKEMWEHFDRAFAHADTVFAEADKAFEAADRIFKDAPEASQANVGRVYKTAWVASNRRERWALFRKFISMAVDMLFHGRADLHFKWRDKC